jgi:hypothetical protein
MTISFCRASLASCSFQKKIQTLENILKKTRFNLSNSLSFLQIGSCQILTSNLAHNFLSLLLLLLLF